MNDELRHYGVKGMHWGIRRYQNADGSLTAEGKKHYGSGESSSSGKKALIDGKKIAKGAIMAAGVAGAAYLYYKNRSAVNSIVKANANKLINKAKVEIEGFPPKVSERAKRMAQKFGEGISEGLDNAPKKLAKSMVEGATYIAGSYAIARAIGSVRTEDIRQSYNAYNKKNKIGKVTDMNDFIRGSSRYDEDDDDED